MLVATARRSPTGSTTDSVGLQRRNGPLWPNVDQRWLVEDGPMHGWLPSVELSEDRDGYRLVAELPGVDPADVQVFVENNT